MMYLLLIRIPILPTSKSKQKNQAQQVFCNLNNKQGHENRGYDHKKKVPDC